MAVFIICNTSPFTHSTPPHELQTSLPHHAVRFQEKVPRFQEKVPRFQEKVPRFQEKVPRFQEKVPRFQEKVPRFQEKVPRFQENIPRFRENLRRLRERVRHPQKTFHISECSSSWIPPQLALFCTPRRNLPSQPHFLYNTYEINTLFQWFKALFRQVNA